MHYSNGYAVAILVNGRVVETRQDSVVSVPFGADYVIRLVNRNGRRAVAKVSIDGQQVTRDGVVVNAHASVDLQRPLDRAVTFRFASVDSKAAEDHGKAGPDVDGSKGLITVEWRPEKEIYPYGTGYYGALSRKLTDYTPTEDSSLRRTKSFRPESHVLCSENTEQKTSGGITMPDVSGMSMNFCGDLAKSGVTVEGGHSSQRFHTVAFNVDYNINPTMLSVKLMGYVESEGMPHVGTHYCPACRAKTMKKTDKYCRICGEQL